MRKCIYRSLLFVPANEEKYYYSVAKYRPDCIILDLEDSISDENKDRAKTLIIKHLSEDLFSGIDVFIRINNNNFKRLEKDIRDTIRLKICGYVIPKIETCDEIKAIINYIDQLEAESLYSNSLIKLIILLETPLGIINAYEISKASNRIIGLGFGAEDYICNINGVKTKDTLLYPRSQMMLAAKSSNIQCYDTVYLDIKNEEGFREDSSYASNMGYNGKLLIHPSQVAIANEIFGYTIDYINKLEDIIFRYEQAIKNYNVSTIFIDNMLIETPHIKRFKYIVEQYYKGVCKNGEQ